MTTNTERVLTFLRSIAPNGVTNNEICSRTGIKPHQQVFQITRNLMHEGRIGGRKLGREWHFWSHQIKGSANRKPLRTSIGNAGKQKTNALSPSEFEKLARKVLGDHYGVEFASGKVANVSKIFDLVSEQTGHVGDAKYYTMVGGVRLPPAKFSVIAEHVWLLEKTGQKELFLVFGNDRRVPVLWLNKYGNLTSKVSFYFLSDSGQLEILKKGH